MGERGHRDKHDMKEKGWKKPGQRKETAPAEAPQRGPIFVTVQTHGITKVIKLNCRAVVGQAANAVGRKDGTAFIGDMRVNRYTPLADGTTLRIE